MQMLYCRRELCHGKSDTEPTRMRIRDGHEEKAEFNSLTQLEEVDNAKVHGLLVNVPLMSILKLSWLRVKKQFVLSDPKWRS